MLTEKEFNVLRLLSEHENASQRFASEKLGYSLGTINNLLKNLTKMKLLDSDYKITDTGIAELSCFEVDNAIILAAGMSSRFAPVSYEIPKGLISVKGEKLIERLIRQLKTAGVKEIVIVVGYMMDKFLYLREKFGVKIVVNPEFQTKNTHSSIYFAQKYLKNSYIVCSDNYYPINMFHKYEYRAFYCSIFLSELSYVERGFILDKNNLVVDTNKPSLNQWIMYGHAYFDQRFSNSFIPILNDYYGRPGIENMYWETIYSEHVKELPLHVLKCNENQILEFDNVDELKKFDPDFLSNNQISVINNICSVLNCSAGDIKNIEIINKGLNNKSFKFSVDNCFYVYRHPGINADNVVDRKIEEKSLLMAKRVGVDNTLIYIDSFNGWKLSKFIFTDEIFDFSNISHVQLLAQSLKKLHSNNEKIGFVFDYFKETKKLINLVSDASNKEKLSNYLDEFVLVDAYLKGHRWQVSLCHNDLYEPNLLLHDNHLEIIDWEFAGDCDIGFDICKLFAVSNPPIEKMDEFLKGYFKRSTTAEEKKHLIACASLIYFYWFSWAIYTQKNGEQASDYLILWHDKMLYFLDLFKRQGV